MFTHVFKTQKPIIGMIHLPPLPGYPKHPGMKYVIQKAMTDLETLQKSGFDGVLIENDNDQPHQIKVSRTITDSFRDIMKQLLHHSKIPVGMEIIYDMWETINVAHEVGAQFVRLDVFVDNVQTQWGNIYAQAKKLIALKKFIGATNLLLLTDIQVKHAQMIDNKTLEQSARDAISYGADAIIVTGDWTGHAPSIADCQKIVKMNSTIPLLIGSGLTIDNINQLLQYSDGAIVGTSIKTGDYIDGQKAKELMDIVKKIRKDIYL